MAIENTSAERIAAIVAAQQQFFKSGKSRSYEFRRQQLKLLAEALKQWEKPLLEALWHDLHKSEQEAILTELSIVQGEVKNHIKNLKRWMKPERRCTPLKMTPSRSCVVTEPLG